MKNALPLLLLAAWALPGPLRAGSELDPLRTVAVQDGGRLKPLDTFARETARRISGSTPFTGGESVKGLDPVEWILAMLSDPMRWQDEAMIKVAHAGLREAISLPPGKDRYSFRELAHHEPFLSAAERVHERLRHDGEARLDPVEQEIASLYENLSLLAAIFSGEALKLVPRGGDANDAWLSLAQLETMDGEMAARLRALTGGLIGAYRAGGRASIAAATEALRNGLIEVAPGGLPPARELQREVHYNRFKPFRASWLFYLLGFLLLLASFPLGSRLASWTAVGFLSAGLLLHTYGLVLRTLISGRAPVTNMYESVIFVAWGAMLFALLFEARYKAGYFAACASPLAVVSLILADSVPILNGSIEPLVPVLRDNMWLTLHVLTIALGYAAFLLAMGLGHLNLGLYFLAPRRAALLKTLSQFLYRSLQVGTLLLAVGTLLGGVWASYSWGRFWGWDPKETWALIALFGYLAILHGRFAGWFRDFGMAVGSILGFLLVLMAWYGVNFILGTGLHSYGFGSGGYIYVGGFVAFELLVVTAAFLRHRKELAHAPAAEPLPSSTQAGLT